MDKISCTHPTHSPYHLITSPSKYPKTELDPHTLPSSCGKCRLLPAIFVRSTLNPAPTTAADV
eukprot:547774-Hanusia_phi.AAC.1